MEETRQDIVHVGRDGWLFLTGGTNGVLKQYRRSPRRWWRLRRWARLVEARAARAEALGIGYRHMLVPEKLSIYDDLTAGLSYDPGLSPACRLARRLRRGSVLVDLVEPMRASRGNGIDLFRRTDTHWTGDGCLLALQALLKSCGAAVPADLALRPRYKSNAVWDLGEKLESLPRETITHWQVARDAKRVHANRLLADFEASGRAGSLHTGAHAVFRNEAPGADPRRVVLFGDSLSHYAPTLLTGFLAECFREVHFVWSANLDWGFIEEVRPDLLIVEMAERFLDRLPADDFELAAAESGAERNEWASSVAG